MLTAPWLRNWLYHGHPLSGVAGLQLLLRGNPAALTYSHQITAAADAPPFLIICIVFPLIALVLTGLAAWGLAIAATGQGDSPRGGGGPPGPEPGADPPDDPTARLQPTMTPAWLPMCSAVTNHARAPSKTGS